MKNLMEENALFSLNYGGKPFFEQDPAVETKTEGNVKTTVFSLPDGFSVKSIVKYYDKYDAYEWVQMLTYNGEGDSELVTDLFDADLLLPLPQPSVSRPKAYIRRPDAATALYVPNGSTWNWSEFNVGQPQLLLHGDERCYQNVGGRSSDGTAPFFNASCENVGYVGAIGWTGSWQASYRREPDGLRVRAGIPNLHFRMLPGESFRTSSFVVMPYEGDYYTGQNRWRRLVKDEFSPVGKGERPAVLPLFAGLWGGMSTKGCLDRIKTIKDEKLPFDAIWMDAGWYGTSTQESADEFEGDWYKYAGDWTINKTHHPDDLLDVASSIRDGGYRYLLWFEPERSIEGMPITKEHPEYFLHCEPIACPLLDLGNDEAWNYCYHTVADLIEKLDLGWYRQDFNMCPDANWNANEVEDRRGALQIRHINGMYRLWDALLERFPHLMIDNCASGGRRIDIETLRRSVPLWRSDYECPADFETYGVQAHSATFAQWMPYSGTSTGRICDEYHFRSAYTAALTTNFTFSERDAFGDDPAKLETIRRYGAEYKKVRPYLSADIWPLTQVTDCTDVFHAIQYDRPEENDGIVLVYRRENAVYHEAAFPLRGISPQKTYEFRDADDDTTFRIDGQTLLSEGFTVTITERPKAKVFFYHAV